MFNLTSAAALDTAICRKAVQQSDPAFDGRFVFGVTSTGIYCRPSCPSRVPRPENMRFFTTISRARAEGFRACKRCHPDATGSDRPQARRAARALELINEGVVQREGVAGLARRMNYSERQLRRLLLAETGEAPLSLSRRLAAST